MGPRSICRSGRAGRGWVGIIPTQCTYRSVSAGAALACMSSRASVRSQVSPFDREVARGGQMERRKKRERNADVHVWRGHNSTGRFHRPKKGLCVCVFVCVRGQERGCPKRLRSPSITVWRCPTARASLHLQPHK